MKENDKYMNVLDGQDIYEPEYFNTDHVNILDISPDEIGITGATGDTGATGAGLNAYGYVYELATLASATIAGGADVPFSNNGPLFNITHVAGSTTVTILTTGDYQIDYSVDITSGVGSEIVIAVNGVVDPSTRISIIVTSGVISGTAILSLTAGDTITLRNNSATPFVLVLSPAVGAQLNIIRLN